MNHTSVKNSETQVLVIYNDARGAVQLKADLYQETIWATQAQIAELFNTQRPAITKHLRNIFKEGELAEKSVCSKMEHTAADGKVYSTFYYNLDAIIAVGYRVNSKKATFFRQWATKTLREYLVKGYVVNEKRLRESDVASVKELQKNMQFIQKVIARRQLDQSEVDSVLEVINGYANSWLLLNQFDEGKLVAKNTLSTTKKILDYTTIRIAIDELKNQLIKRGEAGELFGNERDPSFQGILQTIYQSFDGKELYPSLELKAAHLLYLIIKDHPFSDGNKRIGSFLFIVFLERNKFLYRKNGEKKINDNALVALALLIAQSDPKEKEQMIALVTQLLV